MSGVDVIESRNIKFDVFFLLFAEYSLEDIFS